MCAKLHEDYNKEHVTSSSIFEPDKVIRVFRDFFIKIRNNLRDENVLKLDAFLFPLMELTNHIWYQLGRLYEHFIARTPIQKA